MCKKLKIIVLLSLLLSFLLPIFTSTAKAQIPISHQLLGSVTITGLSDPTGIIVSADVSGVTWASKSFWAIPTRPSTTILNGKYGYGLGDALFLYVLADDPLTPGVKDGAANNDLINIYVDNYLANTSNFESGATESSGKSLRNLTVPEANVIDVTGFAVDNSSISPGSSITASGVIKNKATTPATVSGATDKGYRRD